MEVIKTHIVVFKTERSEVMETIMYQCPGNIWYINYPTYQEKSETYVFRLREISAENARTYMKQ